MTIATINRFISLFDQAFRELGVTVDLADSERLAVLVHHAMNSKTRRYHTAGHVFAMCEGVKPLQVLAALFHDTVYFQLDVGFPMGSGQWLDAVTRTVGDTLVLQPIAPQDTALALCAAIFNFKPGQALPLYGGMNEFLSAVLAARLLQPHLGLAQLITVVACIEATIPFRAPASSGQTAIDALAERVAEQYRRCAPQDDAQAVAAFVHQAVCDAVVLSNRDVSGFAKADPGTFLSATWLLIDESNAPLASPGVYSLQEYRGALVRMAGFLVQLQAAHIFQQYQATPTTEELAELCAAAQRNITFACDFLDAKITSVAIIEALALCTGTDCPVSMFLGDIRSDYGRPDRVEDFLPPAPGDRVLNEALLAVFEKGRPVESSNDLTASPLTAFTYRFMGHQGMHQAFAQATRMFDGTLSPRGFLQALDRDMVRGISHACARIALSRGDALRALADAL